MRRAFDVTTLHVVSNVSHVGKGNIVADLNERGIPAAQGWVWHLTSLVSVLESGMEGGLSRGLDFICR
jgi:hypothetical protein